ncbi:MAG TPA: hypothetical protein VE685_01820 [Thermoanaerobaculia bacterium]|nr:hypothetical protein [Thermoanaerobaculia bacterium]
MPAPSPLPAALLDHAARHPDEPWLFYREGWDWQWHSWGEMAGRVVLRAEGLASLAPGTKVPVPDIPLPDSIVLDLAVQAAGLDSVPEGEANRFVELSQTDLLAAAQRIQDEIPPPPEPRREILVAGRSLFDPADRALFAWATVTGAAVLLEPNLHSRAATAAWARPTVFHGTAEEIAALRRLAGSGKRWWRRTPGLPFGRLRVLFATDGELPEEEAAFWQERGVKVTAARMR